MKPLACATISIAPAVNDASFSDLDTPKYKLERASYHAYREAIADE